MIRILTVTQKYQAYLDACTPYTTYRWVGTGVLLLIFFLRIVLAQGWYIGTFNDRQLDYQIHGGKQNGRSARGQ